ncbi:MAG: hypothetical protein DCO96_06300 [Fluviicola sp. XM-24bin1]|nr:MAG: hypothetical protein DCO96_06300 [Fluviicola sp. XM-24bin1]
MTQKNEKVKSNFKPFGAVAKELKLPNEWVSTQTTSAFAVSVIFGALLNPNFAKLLGPKN